MIGRIIMRQMRSVMFALSVLMSVGCDNLNRKQDQKKDTIASKPKPKAPRTPLHRFVLTRAEDVAFDTQTGQICRTWTWQPVGKAPAPDPVTGGAPSRKFGEFAPLCLDIYTLYPSGFEESLEPDNPITEPETK